MQHYLLLSCGNFFAEKWHSNNVIMTHRVYGEYMECLGLISDRNVVGDVLMLC